ncbi:MAG: c-type cytochrome, partial [Anaerolineae bacterium]|nr:cytochrome c [Thermoflexales bacterium]MDW8407925.1 c-type cytochrome [Anaerolineae bacterium]
DGVDVVEAPKPGEAFAPLPTPVPLTAAQEEGKNLFLKNGCNACHAIRGVANGAIGPALNRIYEEALQRIQSDDYKASQGKATTPEEYIYESIVNPQAYIVPQCPQGPCPANVMPANYGDIIPAADLNKIVDYLSTLGRPADQ